MADIPINDVTPRDQLVDAVGGTTVYAFNFPILDEEDLIVEHTVAATGVTTTLAIAVDYTVAGVGVETGGSVTLLSATAINDLITISRDVPVKRPNDYPTAGDFTAATVNQELDLMTMMMQQLERDISRSLHIGLSDVAADMELPDVDARKGKYLFFDPVDGTPTAAQNLATGAIVVSGFMEPILNSANKAAAQTPLGIVDVSEVFGKRYAPVIAGTSNLPLVTGYDVFETSGSFVTIQRLPTTFADGALVEIEITTGTAFTIQHQAGNVAGFAELRNITGANITAVGGDSMSFRYNLGSGEWDMIRYTRADGTALASTVVENTAVRDVSRNLVIANNASLTLVDIDADELVLQDGSNNPIRLSAVNLTADITASGVNGMDAASSRKANTWYYLYVIHNGLIAASLLSENSSTPTLPGGYTKFALVGACRTDGSQDLYDFVQEDKTVYWLEEQLMLSTLVADVWTAITVSDFYPATAKKVTAVIHGSNRNGLSRQLDGRGGDLHYYDADIVSLTWGGLLASEANGTGIVESRYSSVLRYYASHTTGRIYAWGWEY